MMQHLPAVMLSLLLNFVYPAHGQTVQLLASGTKTSIRGLSVVNDRVLWVSGSNGMVGRSTDGGTHFNWTPVKGFEKADFRDIEAFDSLTAVVMAIASPAYILRTTDGGSTWNTVYENNSPGMFLDAMEFRNPQQGIVIGDPVNGEFFFALTRDGGRSWNNMHSKGNPAPDSLEACFASSGTNIRALDGDNAAYVTGGPVSNLYLDNKKIHLPLIGGKTSTGANSLAVKSRQVMVVVGGDFTNKDDTTGNACITINAGKTWITPSIPPHGYRSCVEWLGKTSWICCGLNGVDLSNDEGETWTWVSRESFHVCRKAKKGNAVFLAGNDGRIAKLL
jgi:hypothetical protein